MRRRESRKKPTRYIFLQERKGTEKVGAGDTIPWEKKKKKKKECVLSIHQVDKKGGEDKKSGERKGEWERGGGEGEELYRLGRGNNLRWDY